MNGRFVISLDFELHWGMFDHQPITEEVKDMYIRTRALIPLLLERFEQRDVHATWATVGALFARDRDELLHYLPQPRPAYSDKRFDAEEQIIRARLLGKNEEKDPCHFGHSLVRRIAETPGQELGSHTYAHVFSLEQGFTAIDLAEDIRAAQAIADDTLGHTLRTLVFPRNQYSKEFIPVLEETGIKTYRTNPGRWFWSPKRKEKDYLIRRMVRYGDDYVPLGSASPSEQSLENGQSNGQGVLAQSFSRFLRPPIHLFDRIRMGEWLKMRRIKREMEEIAREGGIYHLWWHPHNMAVSSDQSFEIIDAVLDHFVRMRDQYGMESRTMIDVAEEVTS